MKEKEKEMKKVGMTIFSSLLVEHTSSNIGESFKKEFLNKLQENPNQLDEDPDE
jgi:hypothetical protein